MPLAAGMGEPLGPKVEVGIFKPTDAQAADQLLNRVSRQFAYAYDQGADKDVLDIYMAVYNWLLNVSQEDDTNKGTSDPQT